MQRVPHTSSDTEGAQRILLDLTGWTLRARQVWFWLGQKQRVPHTSSDTEGAQRILLDLTG